MAAPQWWLVPTVGAALLAALAAWAPESSAGLVESIACENNPGPFDLTPVPRP